MNPGTQEGAGGKTPATLFSRKDIDLSIAAARLMREIDSPEFWEQVRNAMDVKSEIEKTINLLENVAYWMDRAVPGSKGREGN